MFAAVSVSAIALLYGISPRWFAQAFLGIAELNLPHTCRVLGLPAAGVSGQMKTLGIRHPG
jgi:hypothetical protein